MLPVFAGRIDTGRCPSISLLGDGRRVRHSQGGCRSHVAYQSPTASLEVDRSASTTKNRIQTFAVEEFANFRRNVFEHDGERFPGISSGSETLPCNQDFEVTSSFTNILDLVNGIPDAIGELGNCLDLRRSPNRSVNLRHNAADE